MKSHWNIFYLCKYIKTLNQKERTGLEHDSIPSHLFCYFTIDRPSYLHRMLQLQWPPPKVRRKSRRSRQTPHEIEWRGWRIRPYCKNSDASKTFEFCSFDEGFDCVLIDQPRPTSKFIVHVSNSQKRYHQYQRLKLSTVLNGNIELFQES